MAGIISPIKNARVALIQARCSEDVSRNLDQTRSRIEDAARKGAQIVCLQELFRSPYFCQVQTPALFDLAETIPGPTTESLGPIARKLGIVIIASVFEKRTEGIYHNTAVVLNERGEVAGLFRKMHIPDDPLYHEKYFFTPGDLGYRTFETAYGRIGILVCWDQWYPEAARLTALQGAQIIFYPTAIGWHPREKEEFGASQRDSWMTIQRSHAIANGVFVASCNRTGIEKSSAGVLEFWGSSFICDPFGRMLAQGPVDEEADVIADIDYNLIEETRRNWPFLRDRRIDSFQDLCKRYQD